jgi:hypothetical protein
VVHAPQSPCPALSKLRRRARTVTSLTTPSRHPDPRYLGSNRVQLGLYDSTSREELNRVRAAFWRGFPNIPPVDYGSVRKFPLNGTRQPSSSSATRPNRPVASKRGSKRYDTDHRCYRYRWSGSRRRHGSTSYTGRHCSDERLTGQPSGDESVTTGAGGTPDGAARSALRGDGHASEPGERGAQRVATRRAREGVRRRYPLQPHSTRRLAEHCHTGRSR